MRRVISISLPTWPTDLLRRDPGAAPPARPLVTALHDGRRQSVGAADRAAQALGVRVGMPLAHAQAMVPDLAIAPADPEGDACALDALAAWCLRYAPLTAPDRPDGVWIDATGAAHLHGGEAALLADLGRRLARRGVTARAAIADTPGLAWAVARHGATPATVVPVGETASVLRNLPVPALRLSADTVDALARLGFDRIGQLIDAPRAPLMRRFGSQLAHRLDAALGHVHEPIEPVPAPEPIVSRQAFAEPILTPEAMTAVIAHLVDMVCIQLEMRGLGARRLDLCFERIDHTRQVVSIGTARASRQPRHLARLLDERLEQVDPGLGVEAMQLSVPLADALRFTQPQAGLVAGETPAADIAVLVDRLSNRLGAGRVYRALPVESDVPERSVRRTGALGPASAAGWPATLPRPARLLQPPQPVETLSVVPDYPPAHFIWRRQRHRIRRADGPERITGEWWRSDRERVAVRDYWQVEDEDGRRFWLFRHGDGADPATGDMRWFLHGLF